MSLRPAVVFPPLLLEDHDRPCPALVDDFRRHLGTLDQRLADLNSLVAMHQPHIAQFHLAADVAGKTFDLKEGAVFDPILLSTCFHYCVHECFLRDRTGLCITAISKVSRKRMRPSVCTPYW